MKLDVNYIGLGYIVLGISIIAIGIITIYNESLPLDKSIFVILGGSLLLILSAIIIKSYKTELFRIWISTILFAIIIISIGLGIFLYVPDYVSDQNKIIVYSFTASYSGIAVGLISTILAYGYSGYRIKNEFEIMKNFLRVEFANLKMEPQKYIQIDSIGKRNSDESPPPNNDLNYTLKPMYVAILLLSIIIIVIFIATLILFPSEIISITVYEPDPLFVEATGSLTSISPSVDIFDMIDSDYMITHNITGAYTLGTHYVIYMLTEKSGNNVSVTRQIIIQDTIPPKIIPPGDIIIKSSYDLTSLSIDDYGMALAIDLVDPDPMVIHNASSTFPIGSTVIRWTAIDSSGNTANATQTITINHDQSP